MSTRNKHQNRLRFKRRLPARRVGPPPHPSYARMSVLQDQSGLWQVVETDYGRIVIDGFTSNAQAWAWLDQITYDGRDAEDRHRRIRMAFAR